MLQPQQPLFSSSINPGFQNNSLQLTPSPYLLFPSIQPINMPTGPLLVPTQEDRSDPYGIKSYYTGMKEPLIEFTKFESIKTPYDEMNELIRRNNSYIEGDWNIRKFPKRSIPHYESLILENLSNNDLKKEKSIRRAETLEPIKSIEWGKDLELENVSVQIICNTKRKKLIIKLKMHNSRKINELKTVAFNKVSGIIRIKSKVEDSKLIKDDNEIDNNQTLKEANVANDDILYLEILELTKKYSMLLSSKYVDPELLPTLTKNGYKITPDLAKLSKMSLEELKTIEDFIIENEHGKIIFNGLTDVTELNLDKIVQINKKEVLVYPENDVDTSKPEIGIGLNKAATVYLYNCFPQNSKLTEAKVINKKLEKAAKMQGAKHIKYDEKNGTWVFRVSHF